MVLFRGLFVYRLAQAQVVQLATNLSKTISLSELALESYPPQAVSRLSGFRILVGFPQALTRRAGSGATSSGATSSVDGSLDRQVQELRRLLCLRLDHCPQLVAVNEPARGAWIRLASPLDQVWMFTPMPVPGLVSTDPLVLSLSLMSGAAIAVALFLWFEIQRPMAKLEKAMAKVGTDASSAAFTHPLLPQQGLAAVQRLVVDFAVLERLAANERERQTFLAGIAHDLRSPMTRLRLRIALFETQGQVSSLQAEGLGKLHGDLDALERMTQQFLLVAGSGSRESRIEVPLDALLFEQTAAYDPGSLELDLEPLMALVQPVAMGRAVSNLLDNAMTYGRPPFRLELKPLDGDRFRITVIDSGDGIPPEAIGRALEPFHRLDPARGGEGHCGLGLTIVQRIAISHGGQLEFGWRSTPGGEGFGVSVIGQLNAEDPQLD
jgi:two-component system osmolarity sensor histidine kinase EnvZ